MKKKKPKPYGGGGGNRINKKPNPICIGSREQLERGNAIPHLLNDLSYYRSLGKEFLLRSSKFSFLHIHVGAWALH